MRRRVLLEPLLFNFEFLPGNAIVWIMKRAFILAAFLLGLPLLRLSALGEDAAAATAATNAAAVAERQGEDEKFKQLSADIEQIRAANQALVDKISALKDDMEQLRAGQARLAENSGLKDDLKTLAQKIEEVDKKRQDDKEAIADEIKKFTERLERLFAESPAPPEKSTNKSPAIADLPLPPNSVFYTVKEGDFLDAIVAAYNTDRKKEGRKPITTKQVLSLAVNKDVVPTHLRIGQKIVIPLPPD